MKKRSRLLHITAMALAAAFTIALSGAGGHKAMAAENENTRDDVFTSISVQPEGCKIIISPLEDFLRFLGVGVKRYKIHVNGYG